VFLLITMTLVSGIQWGGGNGRKGHHNLIEGVGGV
jgi:hypothetical protein